MRSSRAGRAGCAGPGFLGTAPTMPGTTRGPGAARPAAAAFRARAVYARASAAAASSVWTSFSRGASRSAFRPSISPASLVCRTAVSRRPARADPALTDRGAHRAALRAVDRSRAGCAGSSISAPARAASRSPAPGRCRARASMRSTSRRRRSRLPRINVRRHRLGRRVRLFRSDHFGALAGERYDIIVSQSALCGAAGDVRSCRLEYRHEPPIALAAGRDGLDSVRVILRESRAHLRPEGLLIVEVGNTEAAVRRAFRRLPFVWLDSSAAAAECSSSPMRRCIRAPARPSAAAGKSAVFARRLRHLRRRGTSLCLQRHEGGPRDRQPGDLTCQATRSAGCSR